MYIKLVILACLLAVAQARHIKNFKVSTLTSRIIGGHDAKPGQFPHQISLQYSWPEQKIPETHFCGGSILNEQWILTAAHCLQVLEEDPQLTFIVKAGKHNRIDHEKSEQSSFIDKFIIHELYLRRTKDKVSPYDIGLIKLQSPLKLNKRVVPISLPKNQSEPSGQVTLSGWGAIDNDPYYPEAPNVLQTVNLEIIDRRTCNRAVAKLYEGQGKPLPYDLIDDTNICSGPITGGKSACGGDSGGPLISKKGSGETELVGVVSWGVNPCGISGAPSVYAKTSVFIDWIHDTISKN